MTAQTVPFPSAAAPSTGAPTGRTPDDRVVRAVLAAGRLAPGDSVLLHGPGAAAWEPVLDHLGLWVQVATVEAARAAAARPGAAAFEAAVYVGPASAADGADRLRAADAASLVRPGRASLAAVYGENLNAVPPADALRLPDRRAALFAPLRTAGGPGGWVLHTVPGAARAADLAAAA